MNLRNIKTLSKFLRKSRDVKDLTPYEYAQEIAENGTYSSDGVEVEIFLSYVKHETFLNSVADTIMKQMMLAKASKFNLTILIYILIFGLDEDNVLDVLQTLRNMKNPNTLKVLSYLTEEDNLVSVAQDACKIFDNDYVLCTIINPFLRKSYLLHYLIDAFNEEKKQSKKPATVPDRLQVLERQRKTPQAPANTPLPSSVSTSHVRIPKSVYIGDKNIKIELEKKYEENKARAVQLLEFAKKMAPKVSNVTRREMIGSLEKSSSFKASKAPTKREVNFKQNFTTLIREAAMFIKYQDNEVKRIENIIQGGSDSENYKKIEQEFRRAREAELDVEIEKKKLKCLITREEAILAKKNLQKLNKAKAIEFHKEKMKIMNEIEAWKSAEAIRMKEQVSKVHELEDSAREAARNLQEVKQQIVKYSKFQSQNIRNRILKEKEQELARKVELIKEIKTLHQVRSVHIKEYDPTECPNLGLLCAMSIAELQERLLMLAIKMNQELEDKKKKIANERRKHREFVEDAKTFVAQSRSMKANREKLEMGDNQQVRDSTMVTENPEIAQLKKHLQYVKAQRQHEL